MSLINVLIQDNSYVKESILSSEYQGVLLENETLEIPETQLVYGGDEELDHTVTVMIELDNNLDVVGRMNLSNQAMQIEKQDWEIGGHKLTNYVVRLTANELKLTKNDLFVKPDLQYINNLVNLFNTRNEQIAQVTRL